MPEPCLNVRSGQGVVHQHPSQKDRESGAENREETAAAFFFDAAGGKAQQQTGKERGGQIDEHADFRVAQENQGIDQPRDHPADDMRERHERQGQNGPAHTLFSWPA